MIFGNQIKIKLENIENGVKLSIFGYPKDISITALDFGKDLSRRKMEGYSPDPDEEIDVISGIKDEKTTGEDIVFLYEKGSFTSGLILAGVLAKKLLNYPIKATPLEIGGIFYGDKNEAYIRVAIQKMAITNDSLGSSLEMNLSSNVDLLKFKSLFSYISFSLIPEVQAIQFGLGTAASKKSSSNMPPIPKRVEVSLAPHFESKIPALACIYDVIFESIAAITLINI
ncbi:hypothetical protein [Cetobacterium sp.]|uniref:hypothetical protein n=1 Tax=Cetobacterium sp. TaxID=2071632 RepID=UPI002FC71278